MLCYRGVRPAATRRCNNAETARRTTPADTSRLGLPGAKAESAQGCRCLCVSARPALIGLDALNFSNASPPVRAPGNAGGAINYRSAGCHRGKTP